MMIRGALGFGIGGLLCSILLWNFVLLQQLLPSDIGTMILLGVAGGIGGISLWKGWQVPVGYVTAFAAAFLPIGPVFLFPIWIQGLTGEEPFFGLFAFFFTSSLLIRFIIAGALGTGLVCYALEIRSWYRYSLFSAAGFTLGHFVYSLLAATLLFYKDSIPSSPKFLYWVQLYAPITITFIIGGAITGTFLNAPTIYDEEDGEENFDEQYNEEKDNNQDENETYRNRSRELY